MITYTTGDLFSSNAEALVNAVNCEGYMGKGIAYQFKLKYPHNFEEYRKACKSGYLRPGKLVYCQEDGKTIINFPTKDKWKNESKIEYISDGLSALISLIEEMQIESIAIPPLGAGNGGLIWSQVRNLMEEKLSAVAQLSDIVIFEPSKAFAYRPTQEPQLSASALVLMEIKQRLNRFGQLRLQKAGYFTNIFLKKPYFTFSKYKYGPYSHAIDVISSNIKDFQVFHDIDSTTEAERILYKKIVSKTVDDKLAELMPAIELACNYVNGIKTNHELEGLATVCFIIENHCGISDRNVINEFLGWSVDKAERFNEGEISAYIDKLYNDQIIDRNLDGLILNK